MKLFIKLTVALLTTSLLLAAPASADNKISTKTKIHASDTKVKVGAKVTFKVQVTSKNKKCYKNRKIDWYKNGHFKKKRQLGPQGKVKFKLNMKAAGSRTYQAKYPGYEFGKHPKHHTCTKSHSKVVTIHVKPKN
jgi:hypothetical protein